MSEEDALAIKAYLFSLPPVQAQAPPDRLRFPLNQRWAMVFWNLLFNPDHRFRPDPSKSADNRGAYLVEALGHCQQCHTPRNFLQGLQTSDAFAGAVTQDWRAYNLTSDRESGLGGWSDRDLAAYLQAGQAQGHGAASGPMAEAVDHSLRYLTTQDIRAMVVYLRGVPPSIRASRRATRHRRNCSARGSSWKRASVATGRTGLGRRRPTPRSPAVTRRTIPPARICSRCCCTAAASERAAAWRSCPPSRAAIPTRNWPLSATRRSGISAGSRAGSEEIGKLRPSDDLPPGLLTAGPGP
jgi:mono/diheme cytochrome c family protein